MFLYLKSELMYFQSLFYYIFFKKIGAAPAHDTALK